MTTALSFQTLIADTCGVKLPSVRKLSDALRAAELLSPGSKPHWTTSDVVNLLVAVLTDSTVATAAETVQAVRALPVRSVMAGPAPIAYGSCAGVALGEILDSMRNGEFLSWAQGRPTVVIVEVVDRGAEVDIAIQGEEELFSCVTYRPPGYLPGALTRRVTLEAGVLLANLALLLNKK